MNSDADQIIPVAFDYDVAFGRNPGRGYRVPAHVVGFSSVAHEVATQLEAAGAFDAAQALAAHGPRYTRERFSRDARRCGRAECNRLIDYVATQYRVERATLRNALAFLYV